MSNLESVVNTVNTAALIKKSLVDWRPVLANECQVYVIGDNYLAKRFDQINFRFCGAMTAKEILIDNLFALLRYKYFPKVDDEVDKRIQDIIKSFTVNIKTTLKRVSFDEESDCDVVKFLDDGQIAFRNGVFDFKKNDWLFKYEIVKIKSLRNNIYMYDPKYVIQWYFNFDFDPLPVSIHDMNLNEFVDMMKETDKESKNYCFELMYNICHDEDHNYSLKRFKHLCEIFGYTCLQSFSQNFVMLIGAGQNGKNSVFDGCFSNRLVPRPSANSLDEIENDRFVTGSLENTCHNIFLETSPKTHTESKMLKALTGSMNQTIQNKGENKYSSFINCKYLFAGNDQEKIKFTDTTTGFRRRINLFEIFYRWDPSKRFMLKGDYYDTTFSDSLKEIKEDISNTIVYIYFAMYGIMSATNNFTSNFKFTENDWKLSYSDIDFDLKEQVENIGPEKIVKFIRANTKNYEDCHFLFYDTAKEKLYESKTIKILGYYNFEDMIKMFEDEEAVINYFAENDAYMNVRLLQLIIGDMSSAVTFSQSLKKLYGIPSYTLLHSNKPYVKVRFVNNKLKVIV